MAKYLLAALLWAGPAVAQDLLPEDPGTWIKLFTGLDTVALLAIGILAFVLKRSLSVPEHVAILMPLTLGVIYGVAQAVGADYAPAAFVMKGALMNGAGATMIGRVVGLGMNKWWPPDPPAPPPVD